MLKIAHAKGPGAAKTKQAVVEKLLVAARGEETRFLVRTLGQNLRVGAVRTSLAALARAMVLTPPTVSAPIPGDSPFRVSAETLAAVKPLNAKKKVADEARDAVNEVFARAESLLKRVYVQHPDYDHIVKALLDVGLDGLAQQLPLTVGESRVCRQTYLLCFTPKPSSQACPCFLPWDRPPGRWMRSMIGSAFCRSPQNSSTTVSAPRSTHQGAMTSYHSSEYSHDTWKT